MTSVDIKSLSGKISKNLYLIRSIKSCLPKWSIRNLYFSYIQSTIEYGILLWGSMVNKSSLKRIFIQQKKAIRAIDGAKYNSNSSPLFKSWKILKLDDLMELHLAKLAYMFTKQKLPQPVLSLFHVNSFNHNYNTLKYKV